MRQRMMQDQYANHRPPVKVEEVEPSNVAANVASNNGVSNTASHPVSDSYPPGSTLDDTEREIYDSLPKSMQRKAKLFIDKIISRSDMRWTTRNNSFSSGKWSPVATSSIWSTTPWEKKETLRAHGLGSFRHGTEGSQRSPRAGRKSP